MERDRKSQLLSMYDSNRDEKVYEEARVLYQEALEKEPDNVQLLYDYGYLMESKAVQLLREAVCFYEKGISLAPDNLKLQYQLIGVRTRLWETRISVEYYKKRIDENPEDAANYSFLATSYLRSDQLEEARKVVEAGLRLFPRNAHILMNAVELYERLDDVDQVLILGKMVLEANPLMIDVRYSAAFALERAGRLEDAAREWREIIKFLYEHDYQIDAEWPEQMLKSLEERINRQKTDG